MISEENENNISISSMKLKLFDLPEKPVSKHKSERAELLKFFVDNLWNKSLKNFPAKRIAIALSHIPTKDLYFMQSVAKDIMARRGIEAMNKWFWWSIKAK